ncbi:LapA family protein [Allosediminivita pacifica]|uniref:Uncharacterized protein DUF1049 n=1 Tax=Allosediminivita pacifica TaxID=1267769 RepID=A0A2T6B7W3_9RHOB|nr:LapA family protein [Allosediminivita pacifica]PTX52136.1 uncharacterized protein DUF1049 [Allosediminivita pacifica]GGA96840.1 phosphoribosylanthranilate isomerase [Allosediminivita pacifica]
MRYIRYAFLAILAIVLITVALANLGNVTLNTLPEGMATLPWIGLLAFSVEMPLFLVILGGIVAGLLIGFLWEWLREHKHRADARRKQAELNQLNRELRKTRAERDKDKDEVLALLDRAG